MKKKEMYLQGKVWVISDKKGKLIENIDTDQIYHNAYLYITDLSRMGRYAFGNLEGWRDFSEKAQQGDVVIAGRNFGAGSSRQQAVDCFIALKIGMILAPSFGAIYFRNAINSGFPVLKSLRLDEFTKKGKLISGDTIEVEIVKGKARNMSQNFSFQVEPMSSVQYDIFMAGNLFNYGKKFLEE